MKLYTCDLCGEKTEDRDDIKHLPLYVSGSEGIYVCLECRIVLTNVAKGIKSVANKNRKQGYIACLRTRTNERT